MRHFPRRMHNNFTCVYTSSEMLAALVGLLDKIRFVCPPEHILRFQDIRGKTSRTSDMHESVVCFRFSDNTAISILRNYLISFLEREEFTEVLSDCQK